jgi:CheY-like chemotaxis protein
VALLDVLMPEMDGPQVLAALRRLCPALRWCFMTGGPGPYSEKALLCSGAARVFRKPFALADVIETVCRLAHRARVAGVDRWIELPPHGA